MEQVLSTIPIMIFLGCVIYSATKGFRTLRQYHGNGVDRLRSFVKDNCGGEPVDYYWANQGLWVKCGKDFVESRIKSTCVTEVNSRCKVYHEAKFCFEFDEEKRGVLVVFDFEDYDFSKVFHYNEWAEGNKEFNERVNKAMGRS